MPNILVRNLSEETVTALKALAKKNNRSTQAELVELIEDKVRPVESNAFWEAAERARKESAGRWHENSADLIREDRDSR